MIPMGNRHRYLQNDQIEQIGPLHALSIFRRVLSQDINCADSKECSDVKIAITSSDGAAILSYGKSMIAPRNPLPKRRYPKAKWRNFFELSETENGQLRQEKAALEAEFKQIQAELKQVQNDNWNLKGINSQLKQTWATIQGKEDALRNVR